MACLELSDERENACKFPVSGNWCGNVERFGCTDDEIDQPVQCERRECGNALVFELLILEWD